MDDFEYGKSVCEKCNKTIKWIGYRTRRNHINSSIYDVFRIPKPKKDEITIDFSRVDEDGNISFICPYCLNEITMHVE